eukprot:m.142367 g.142367  ORF g.142367 m.142367 type:complete len:825 (-) comp10036_c0_seq1:143-2617(-)
MRIVALFLDRNSHKGSAVSQQHTLSSTTFSLSIGAATRAQPSMDRAASAASSASAAAADDTESLAQGIFWICKPPLNGQQSTEAAGAGFAPPPDLPSENPEITKRRHAAFEHCWELMRSAAHELLHAQNERIFDDICTFYSEFSGCRRAVASPYGEMPAALLLTGVNTPDHETTFLRLQGALSAAVSPLVVQLNSSSCPNMRALLRCIMHQLLAEQQRLPVYSVEVIHDWYCAQFPESAVSQSPAHESAPGGKRRRVSEPTAAAVQSPPIVLVVQDFESFSPEALSDLVFSLSQRALPIFFVFGISSTPDALHRHLDQRAIRSLSTEQFVVQNASMSLSDVVRHLLLHPKFPVRIASKPLGELVDEFTFANFSVHSFLKGLHYAVFSHFAWNPLSIICDDESTIAERLELLSHEHLELIRQLPSFRPLIESLDADQRRSLLTDDEALRARIPLLERDLHMTERYFQIGIELMCAITAIMPESEGYSRHLPSVMATCLKRTVNPLRGDFKAMMDMIRLAFSAPLLTDLLNIVRQVADQYSSDARIAPGVMQAEEYLAVLDRLQNPDRTIEGPSVAILAQNLLEGSETELEDEQDDADAADVHGASLQRQHAAAKEGAAGQAEEAVEPPADRAQSKSRNCDELLRSGARARPSRKVASLGSRRAALRRRETPTNVFERARSEIVNWLSKFLVELLKSPCEMPLSEIFYFDESLSPALQGRVTSALYTALNEPSTYIRCQCCDPDDDLNERMPDTIIAYKLHLEFPPLVNLHDWFLNFSKTIDPEGEPDEAKMARFTQAVSELQHLGLLKRTGIKVDHVKRLGWWLA